jgi:hypothetical protein
MVPVDLVEQLRDTRLGAAPDVPELVERRDEPQRRSPPWASQR